MWKYVKLCSCNSPMQEILSNCSCKSNIRLVVYHLSENHVECATTPEVDQHRLGENAKTMMNDSRHNHAILAYDLGKNEVYKIEDVPELPIASAVLLCVVTELLNGCVQPRENQYGIPAAAQRRAMPTPPREVTRAANGRFVRQEPRFEEEHVARPSNVVMPKVGVNNNTLTGHRFRLGKH